MSETEVDDDTEEESEESYHGVVKKPREDTTPLERRAYWLKDYDSFKTLSRNRKKGEIKRKSEEPRFIKKKYNLFMVIFFNIIMVMLT